MKTPYQAYFNRMKQISKHERNLETGFLEAGGGSAFSYKESAAGAANGYARPWRLRAKAWLAFALW